MRRALAGGLAAVSLAAAAPAEAYRFAGPRWPNKTARVGVRFERAPLERARVIIRYSPGDRGRGLFGCEGVGGGTGAGYPTPFVAEDVYVVRGCASPAIRRLIVAHELGHVLGLGHEDRRCALMNSRGSPTTKLPARCRPSRRLTRRLLTKDDIRGARRLYRRKPPAVDPIAAQFNPQGSVLYGPAPVQFGASAPNPALDYRWDFGDPASGAANSGTGTTAAHAYPAPGTYTITLTVIDGGAVIAVRSQQLELVGSFS